MVWRRLSLVLGLVLAVFLAQRFAPFNLFHYGFYLRVPIVCGLLLFFLWLIALRVAPAMLANIAELKDPWHLVMVLVGAVITGMAIVRVSLVAAVNTQARFLPTLNPSKTRPITELVEQSVFQSYGWLALLLALPTMIWVVYRSPRARQVWALLLAAALSFGFLWLYGFLVEGNYLSPLGSMVAALLRRVSSYLGEGFSRGYLRAGNLAATHLELVTFYLLSSLVYLFGFWLFKPRPKFQTPVLFFVLLILTNLCLLLSGLAFFFDYYRLPLLFTFMLLGLTGYWLWGIDHSYRLHVDSAPKPDQDATLKAIKERLRLQNKADKTVVVVTAAGGGIQASAWTAKALGELETLLATSLSQKVVLVSSVSGGTVGTLFYVDRFDSDGSLKPAEAGRVFESATEDNLDAIGYALAYPDLWRLVGVSLRELDRGLFLEDDWGRVMREGKSTFKDWQHDMLAGRKPITVFNAILVQNGQRYLLSPLTLEELEGRESICFNKLYPDLTIATRTAARLSATFPYVSPIARNSQGKDIFHVADGGYFDNFGVFTAVNFLNDVLLPKAEELGIKRVLVLEIRSFPEGLVTAKPSSFTGWIMQALGPLLAMFSVRASTQTARNQVELGDVVTRWNHAPLEVHKVKLVFPGQFKPRRSKKGIDAFATDVKQTNYSPPLSWKLSEEQINAILDAWDHVKENDEELKRLEQLWRKWQGGS